MASVTIGGKYYALAPLGFKELKLAAPHIDAINGRVGEGTLAAGADSTSDMLAVLAVASLKAGGGASVQDFEDALSIEEMTSLGAAFRQLMEDSGLFPKGEQAPAPKAGQPAESAKS